MNSLLPPLPQDDALSKKRTRVTPSQLIVLEDTFAVSATPDSKMRKHLALKLQMPERSIQIWFQNRRAKVKMLQRRAVLREEQEVARAKLYSDSAAAAAAFHQHHPNHQSYWFNGVNVPPPPPPHTLPPNSYLPHHLNHHHHHHHQMKVPIQRSWSSDPAPPPPPFPPSSLSMYTNSLSDTISLDEKDPFYPGNISLSPTPVTELNPDTLKSLNDSTFLNNNNNNNTNNNNTTRTTGDTSTGIINANAITIGTWHRMKINQQDLLCCFQLTERTFEWHIRDSNYHFKMVISFDLLTSLDITISENGMFAQIDMDLKEAPLFFMENMDDSTWIQCSDFTEGMQATCHLHHTIRGLASDLRQEIFGIIGMDHHLCQIIRFPMVPNLTTTSSSTNTSATTTTTTTTTDQDTVDFSSLMSWRHQSVPLNMKDFEWSHPSTSF